MFVVVVIVVRVCVLTCEAIFYLLNLAKPILSGFWVLRSVSMLAERFTNLST